MATTAASRSSPAPSATPAWRSFTPAPRRPCPKSSPPCANTGPRPAAGRPRPEGPPMLDGLLERFRRGDRLALSRLLSLLARGEAAEELLARLPPPARPARVVALT